MPNPPPKRPQSKKYPPLQICVHAKDLLCVTPQQHPRSHLSVWLEKMGSVGTLQAGTPWTAPGESSTPLQAAHPGGCNVLLCDGSVRFLSGSLAMQTLYDLANRDDGDPLGEF